MMNSVKTRSILQRMDRLMSSFVSVAHSRGIEISQTDMDSAIAYLDCIPGKMDEQRRTLQDMRNPVVLYGPENHVPGGVFELGDLLDWIKDRSEFKNAGVVAPHPVYPNRTITPLDIREVTGIYVKNKNNVEEVDTMIRQYVQTTADKYEFLTDERLWRLRDSAQRSAEAFASVSEATEKRLSEPEQKQADDSVRFMNSIITNQKFDELMDGDVPSLDDSLPPSYIVDLTLRPPQVVMRPTARNFLKLVHSSFKTDLVISEMTLTLLFTAFSVHPTATHFKEEASRRLMDGVISRNVLKEIAKDPLNETNIVSKTYGNGRVKFILNPSKNTRLALWYSDHPTMPPPS